MTRIDPGPPWWDGELWRRRTCDLCGGDFTTHLAVAGSLSRKAGVKISVLMDMPCTLVNRLHKAIMEAERSA